MSSLVPINRNRSLLRPSGFEDFYNVIDDFFNESRFPSKYLVHSNFKLDVKENEKDFKVEAELPGVKKEELNIELNDGVLSISVNREEKKEEKRDNYIYKERRSGSMHRSIYLGDVKADGVEAKFEDGVLHLTVPKDENTQKAHKIEVK